MTRECSDLPDAWIQLLIPVADDEWIMAHRGSEWLGLAPDLEGDLAFSSINQDEMGHALFYYALIESLGEPSPDSMVYSREAGLWRNARVLEAVQGDWAQTMALRYFYEVFDDLRQEGLSHASFASLREGTAKVRREEAYHLQHFTTWFDLLAEGTTQSRARLTDGVAHLWPQLGDLFSWGPVGSRLSEMGLDILRESAMREAWECRVKAKFDQLRMKWPGPVPKTGWDGRRGEHSGDLAALLGVMGAVQQSDRGASW